MYRIWSNQRGRLGIDAYIVEPDEATIKAAEMAEEHKGKNIYLENTSTGEWLLFHWVWLDPNRAAGQVDIMQIEPAKNDLPAAILKDG